MRLIHCKSLSFLARSFSRHGQYKCPSWWNGKRWKHFVPPKMGLSETATPTNHNNKKSDKRKKKHRRGRQKTVMCKIWAHAHAHVRHVRNSDAFGQIELNSNRLINNRSNSTECALSHRNFAGSFCRNQSQPIAFGILVVCWCRGLVYFVLCVRTLSTVDMMISFGPKRVRRIQCSWNDKLLCARSPAMHD